MSEEPKKGGWVEASQARRFDPTAEAGTEWAELCAAAVRAIEAKGPPLAVPIDPAARASGSNSTGPWGVKESIRMHFALRLLDIFDRCEVGTLRLLANRLEEIRRDGMPDIAPGTLDIVTALEAAEKEGRGPTKEDVKGPARRRFRGKNYWTKRFRDWGLKWWPQKQTGRGKSRH